MFSKDYHIHHGRSTPAQQVTQPKGSSHKVKVAPPAPALTKGSHVPLTKGSHVPQHQMPPPQNQNTTKHARRKRVHRPVPQQQRAGNTQEKGGRDQRPIQQAADAAAHTAEHAVRQSGAAK